MEAIGMFSVERRRNDNDFWTLLHDHGETVGEPKYFRTVEAAREWADAEATFSGFEVRIVQISEKPYGRSFDPIEGGPA